MISPAAILRRLELPLLTKELNEQAARPRTYIVRFLYAAVLFTAGCALFYGDIFSGGRAAAGNLGQGRYMFERLVLLQFGCIYLLMPAVSCGCLTAEKERNTLGLLLISALNPWEIVLQKLLGRVVPMLTLVLAALPLMAIAYSFGGVTEDQLWSGIALLLLAGVQAGALSVMCSAYYPTTVEAFIANYVLFIVGYFLFPFCWGPYVFERAAELPFAATVVACLLQLFVSGGFVLAARMFLESRAFVSPKNALLGLFRALDRFFSDANKVTGGVILVRDGDPLPGNQPIAWRETAKKSLGTFRYLFRVLVVLELPLIFVCQSLRLSFGPSRDLTVVSGLLYGLWGLGAAMIIIHAGSVISSERTRQTLDVLLTTPILGRELLLQKLRGVRRLIGVLLVPFTTVFAFETWWYAGSSFRGEYLGWTLATIAVYPPLTAWLAMAIGLRVRSQMRVVLGTTALVSLWLLVPTVIRYVFTGLLGMSISPLIEESFNLDPAVLITALEALPQLRPPADPPRLWYAGNLLLHTGVLVVVRHWCLRNADRLVGRLGEPRHLRSRSFTPRTSVSSTSGLQNAGNP